MIVPDGHAGVSYCTLYYRKHTYNDESDTYINAQNCGERPA